MERGKFLGCIVGGAVGDALGYPVEFLNDRHIYSKYGESGITRYELQNGVAEISDDTQMTLFTANGLLIGTTRGRMRGLMAPLQDYVWSSYCDWYQTQRCKSQRETRSTRSWLCGIRELYSCRAPGTTCMSAIEQNFNSGAKRVQNDSKGCGGVMRVAPVGLLCGRDERDGQFTLSLGEAVAALTRGHPLGYIPAATLAHLIAAIVADEESKSLQTLVEKSIEATKTHYPNSKDCDYLCQLLDKAIQLSDENIDDNRAISMLGEGWVAEEALAIAIYCALKHSTDFEKAIVAAVNHSGDSDSTGAICGNIVGVYLGLSAIPQHYIDNLEIYDIILSVADDLYTGCTASMYEEYTPEERLWLEKYMGFGSNHYYRRIIDGIHLHESFWRVLNKHDNTDINGNTRNMGENIESE